MNQRLFYLFATAIIVAIIFTFFKDNDSGNRVNLQLNRFEQELFSINSDNIDEKYNMWNQEFKYFNKVLPQIINVSSSNESIYYSNLLAFTQDKDMREAYDSTAKLFIDFTDIQDDLELAFGQFNVYFPSYPLPEITTFFGGFNYGVITYEDNIGIGLDWFLGSNSKYYRHLRDPEYLRYQKKKQFILPNVMEVWFDAHFHHSLLDRDLLSQIVYKGKMMYFLDKMLPEIPLEDKFRFTKEQMDWVQNNEVHIWNHFITEGLLFSNNQREFRSFINYAPFAKGMPSQAPGRVGYFIGYQIVNEYMRNNKIDIQELMSLTDSKQFLQKSEYNPK